MGLDMYLRLERSVRYDEPPVTELPNIGKLPAPLARVVCMAMQWRKANQIHGWFVRNVQDDDDDCNSYDVDRDDLLALVDACRAVLANRELAAELLPPAEGFFFGGYQYDDYYFDELQRTADGLTALLEAVPEGSGWWFEYQSSW
jgi:hypothetical protein